MYLQVRAMVIIVCQYSTFVYSCTFDEMSGIKCEIYDQVTLLTLTLTLKPNTISTSTPTLIGIFVR